MTFKKIGDPSERRFSKTQRLVALIGAAVLFLTGAGLVAAGLYVSALLDLVAYDSDAAVPLLPAAAGDGETAVKNPVRIDDVQLRGDTDTVKTILLIGVDRRQTDSYTARSDTNILLSVNTDTRTVKLASLMRDLWVTVPTLDADGDGYADYGKLNAAFYYGGFPLLRETVEENFRLSVPRYVAVDFAAFEKAVDALGGIDVVLSEDEAAFIPKASDNPDFYATPDHPELEPLGHEAGTYRLNGQQALAYCRIRHLYEDNDFARQSNQRTVICTMLQKAKTASFATLTNVLAAVLPHVQTNLSKQELLTYAANALQYASYDVETDFSVPSAESGYEDRWIGDSLGLWLTDPEQTTLALHRYLYNVEK